MAALALPNALYAHAGHAHSSSVSLHGTVRAAHSDDFASKQADWKYELVTAAAVYRLQLDRLPARVRLGARVQVRGTVQGQTLALAGGGSIEPAAAGTVAASVGARKTAVVMFNFAGDSRTPFTADQVRSTVFTASNSVNAYYQEQSFGAVSFVGKARTDGDVYGWYTLDYTSAGCRWGDWATNAISKAKAAGVDFSGYQHVVYLFPTVSSCGWGGLAYVPGSESWINGYLNLGVIGHELGHNLGVHHAGSLACRDSVGRRTPISGSCSFNEYGDPWDIMGNIGTNHTNNWHKAKMSWMGPATHRTASATGSFTIAPQETTSAGVQLVRIPRGTTGQFYYLEFRQPYGFDAFAATNPVVKGVSIRIGTGWTDVVQSQLIDTTSSTTSFGDAPLVPSQVFTDPQYGISVRTDAVTALGASVTVAVNGESLPPPPGGGGGGSDLQAPSAPQNLLATAQVGPAVALSWTASTDNVGVTLYRILRDGAEIGTSTTTSYRDAAVVGGRSYQYAVRAYDAAGNASAASNTATVTTPGGDTSAPTVPAGLAKTSSTATTLSIGWQASTDNVGVAGYGVYLDGTRLGQVTSPAATITNLACGRVYSVGVDAYDAATNTSARATITASTSACGDSSVPTTPTGLQGTTVSGPKVALTWTPSTDNVGVTGYRVYRDGVQVGTSASASYTDAGVVNGSTYRYNVRAYDAAGNLSAMSSSRYVTVQAPTDTTVPSVPTNVAAAAQAGPQVAVSWTASTDNVGVTGYRVYRGATQIGTTTGTSYVDSSVANGATYTYTVRAYDAAGNLSAPSSGATVTVPGDGGGGGGGGTPDTTAPSAPTGFRLAVGGRTSFTLAWTASTDNVGVTGYRAFRSGTAVGTTSSPEFTFTGLSCGRYYSIGVEAYDAAGNRSTRATVWVGTAAC